MKFHLEFSAMQQFSLHFLWNIAIFGACIGVCGCVASQQSSPQSVSTKNEVVAPAVPVVAVPTAIPTLPPVIIQSQKPSLPRIPRMMTDSPRPTFIPQPTPKIRPGETIVISNGVAPTIAPRESPTIIISNARPPQMPSSQTRPPQNNLPR